MDLAKAELQKDAWKLFEAGFSTEEGSLDTYLVRILSHCVEWFGATGGSIFLRQGASEQYALAAQAGSDSNIPKHATITAGSGIAGTSIESGEPLLISDPLCHPLLEGRINTHQVALRSSIVVPLLAANEGCIGVLNLSRNTSAQEFDGNDVQRVAALASHISLAVSNARLFASLREARRLESASRSKLEALLQSLGIAVIAFDAEGRVTDSNRQAQKMLGRNPAAWQSALSHISVALGKATVEAIEKTRSSEYVRTRVQDDRQDRSWSIVATPLPDGGATAILEETTLQDQSQREIARLARLAEIGQMTAAIAHEIRNPLTGIRSAAQLVGSSPEHAAECGEIIEQEALKLNEICEEFLEFARPLDLRRRELDLGEFALSLAHRVREDFDGANVRLKLEIDGGKPTINADALRLEQVMRNLLRNAMQACDSGGEVRLNLRHAGFSVEDTGRGMHEADLQKLFTPFFTTKPHGTGLGLCNVRKIVDAHGGRLEVWSKPGVGSRFDVTIGGAE